jgi:thymidylate synthase (FAD)
MDCWRQWIRHRTASVNEYSTRYSEAIDAAQATPESEWREQAAGNRQGSQGFIDPEKGSELSRREAELQTMSRQLYEDRLQVGVAREQARKDLPLATIRKLIGKPTFTICFISWRFAWMLTLSWKFVVMPV